MGCGPSHPDTDKTKVPETKQADDNTEDKQTNGTVGKLWDKETGFPPDPDEGDCVETFRADDTVRSNNAKNIPSKDTTKNNNDSSNILSKSAPIKPNPWVISSTNPPPKPKLLSGTKLNLSDGEDDVDPLAIEELTDRSHARPDRAVSGKSTISSSRVHVTYKHGVHNDESVGESKGRLVGSANGRKGAVMLWETTSSRTGILDNVNGVAFMDENTIVVTQDCEDQKGLETYMIDDCGNPGPIIAKDTIGPTRGVSVYQDVMALTDPERNSVKFVKTNGEFVSEWKKDLFKMVGGLTQSKNDFYVVSDVKGRDKSICIVNQNGKITKRMGKSFFDWPWYVAVNSKCNIIVCDQSSSTVFIFDKGGKLQTKFGRHGKGDGQLNFPNGIVIDDLDNIIIADTNNRRISQYDSNGQFVHYVVSHLNYKPLAIAILGNGLAVVSESALYYYKIFEQKSFLD